MRAFVDKVYGVLKGCHIYDFQIMDAAAPLWQVLICTSVYR